MTGRDAGRLVKGLLAEGFKLLGVVAGGVYCRFVFGGGAVTVTVTMYSKQQQQLMLSVSSSSDSDSARPAWLPSPGVFWSGRAEHSRRQARPGFCTGKFITLK
jgi:hypothetical protein